MIRNLITAVVLVVLFAAGYYLWMQEQDRLGGEEPVACTADAKRCPDGTAVGRAGPNCDFAPCPSSAAGGPYESSLIEAGGATIRLSLTSPQGWSADEAYQYRILGPDDPGIPGIKFSVAEWMVAGSNLSYDTGISVEYLTGVEECSAEYFLYEPMALHTVEDQGVTYSVASMAGAAAGSRYEEQVWALAASEPCVAVRYYTHTSEVGNYEPGTVVEFDQKALLAVFDEMRRSLTVVTE